MDDLAAVATHPPRIAPISSYSTNDDTPSCTPEILFRWAPGVNRYFLPILATHSDRNKPPNSNLLNPLNLLIYLFC